MTLIYTQQDASQWATFSGDYNPIHFDLKKAQAMGLGGLTVHGMRALLDIKDHQDFSQGTEAYYRFIARLRHPVKCHTHYQIAKTQNQSQLIESATGLCCFSGKLEQTAPPIVQPGAADGHLTPDDILKMRQEYPFIKNIYEWSFLDAVLFRLIVQSPEILPAIKVKLPDLNATTLADIFRATPVVQTHHEILFSGQYLLPAPGANNFQYRMLPLLIMGDFAHGLVVRIAMQGHYDAIHSPITTAITLKLLPMAKP